MSPGFPESARAPGHDRTRLIEGDARRAVGGSALRGYRDLAAGRSRRYARRDLLWTTGYFCERRWDDSPVTARRSGSLIPQND